MNVQSKDTIGLVQRKKYQMDFDAEKVTLRKRHFVTLQKSDTKIYLNFRIKIVLWCNEKGLSQIHLKP